jgi:hypothetical protein
MDFTCAEADQVSATCYLIRPLNRQIAQKCMRMFLLTFASLAILFLYLRYLLFRLPEPYDHATARIRSSQRLRMAF